MSAGSPGAIYAISSIWDWRKGNSHKFQVGWGVGFQAHRFTPGIYDGNIFKKVKGGSKELIFTEENITILSSNYNHYFHYSDGNPFLVLPEHVGYSFVVEVGGKTDLYQAVQAE